MAQHQTHHATSRHAFTLIELLVVISIIGLLVALLLPALAMANNAAKAVSSLAATQQTMVAYNTYSTDHKDRLLYGYLPETLYGKAVSVQFQGHTLYDKPAQRYPMRLAEYQGDSWEMIYNGRPKPDVPSPGDADFASKAYQLGLYPSIGINSLFVGGDHSLNGFVGNGGRVVPNVGGIAVFTMQAVRSPSELIAMAETRYYEGGELQDTGYHLVSPPIRGNRRWQPDGDQFDFLGSSASMGVPAGRFSDAAAIGFIDGHSEAMKPQDLNDMRRWSNYATAKDDHGLSRMVN